MSGAELKQLRNDALLTQTGLAELLAVGRATIARWEASKKSLPYVTEVAICKVLEDAMRRNVPGVT